MIKPERLAADFAALAAITAPGGGINRLAFTDSDWQGRAYFMQEMEKTGLTLHGDAFGNVIGHLEGRDDSLPAVMLGSHGDSVPNGGNYDGTLGIVGAIETVRSMQDDGFRPLHPLEVVIFMCEESSRFSAATLGSRAMRGRISREDVSRLRDHQGNTLYDVLKARGLQPDALETARYTKKLKAFLELHIEQGRVLEHERLSIGIVTGIAAPSRFFCLLRGTADHSGATPMNLRADASCAAAEIILAVEQEARAAKHTPVVGTVGIVEVQPNVMNVIPGEVRLGIDLRSTSSEDRDNVEQIIRTRIEEIALRRGISCEISPISKENPAHMDTSLIQCLAKIADDLHLPHRMMPSGAGHDAMHWADYAPTAMIFIPCKDGISHSAAEYASLSQITAGVRLLSAAVRHLTADV